MLRLGISYIFSLDFEKVVSLCHGSASVCPSVHLSVCKQFLADALQHRVLHGLFSFLYSSFIWLWRGALSNLDQIG